MKPQRNTKTLMLDALLCARRTQTPTQLMFDVGTCWTDMQYYIKKGTEEGLLEEHQIIKPPSSSSRARRRNMGLNPYAPSIRGARWIKTTPKGELFIETMKKMWELHDKDPAFKGTHPFDYVGKLSTMHPPKSLNKNALKTVNKWNAYITSPDWHSSYYNIEGLVFTLRFPPDEK